MKKKHSRMARKERFYNQIASALGKELEKRKPTKRIIQKVKEVRMK